MLAPSGEGAVVSRKKHWLKLRVLSGQGDGTMNGQKGRTLNPFTSLRKSFHNLSSHDQSIRSAMQAGSAPAGFVLATPEKGFIIALESIRGLAALSVALFHSFHLLPVDGVRVYDRTLWNIPSTDGLLMRLIMIPFNGGAGVSLFFVLSGFVLALSLYRDDRQAAAKAGSFFARRIFRIYPTLAINIVLIAVVIAAIATYVPIVPVSPVQIDSGRHKSVVNGFSG